MRNVPSRIQALMDWAVEALTVVVALVVGAGVVVVTVVSAVV